MICQQIICTLSLIFSKRFCPADPGSCFSSYRNQYSSNGNVRLERIVLYLYRTFRTASENRSDDAP
jgi:hypothetical protein